MVRWFCDLYPCYLPRGAAQLLKFRASECELSRALRKADVEQRPYPLLDFSVPLGLFAAQAKHGVAGIDCVGQMDVRHVLLDRQPVEAREPFGPQAVRSV